MSRQARPTSDAGGLAEPSPADWRSLTLTDAGRLAIPEVLRRLRSSEQGIGEQEAAHRLLVAGPNAIKSHGARPLQVLLRQLKNPLLLLLGVATLVSLIVGERTDAYIIIAIIGLSVGLGFLNEYRSEKAVEELHSRIRHTAVTTRDGRASAVDVTQLVPGDVVRLDTGDIVPADLRLLDANNLEIDEAVLTGESMPMTKRADPDPEEKRTTLRACPYMGTIVRGGTGRGVVVKTGGATEFGQIALRLGERPPETAFQHGLRDFSRLLVHVTLGLSGSIFLINVVLGHGVLNAALFALAIAVGLTPQLLPAIVTVSLSTGARHLARRSVVVKRLVSIEDLGNIHVLLTDKTGTLTEGRIRFLRALDPQGGPSSDVLRLGLACAEAVLEAGEVVGGNPLDRALWESPGARSAGANRFRRVGLAPFDFDRKMMSVLVEQDGGRRTLITKGAPELVLARCRSVPASAPEVLESQFSAGSRVIAVATKDGSGLSSVTAADEKDLNIAGFLVFADPLKGDAARSLQRLHALDITVKVVTGDNERVAQKVCTDVGLEVSGVLSGGQIEAMSDDQLAEALPHTTIFARVTPEQKSRIIRAERALGNDVGFLGDGVNDAVAMHDADVGISVDSATDVAKDAADIVLMEKDLGILADGVMEGRRIFSNTIKYVLMGTSSNFGNMFSAAGASLFLKFLPMLPTQILLNNLLYDVSEMTIPTDHVDAEMLERPARWDTKFIRRFMWFFGPISSLYDFMTFGVMLWVFHAGPTLFHTAWFVESLSTQTLIIFIIRTRRVPFLRSRPSLPLTVTSLACVATGLALPFIGPFARLFGFTPLPASFLGILVGMIVTYLALAEAGKAFFFRPVAGAPSLSVKLPPQHRRIRRIVMRWSRPQPRLPDRHS